MYWERGKTGTKRARESTDSSCIEELFMKVIIGLRRRRQGNERLSKGKPAKKREEGGKQFCAHKRQCVAFRHG